MHSRRQLLSLAPGLLALAATRVSAAPPEGRLSPELEGLFDNFNTPLSVLQVDLPQLQYGGNWNPRPGAMRELATELRLRTRLEPLREPSVVSLDSPKLFQTPWLYIAGQGGLPPLGDAAQAQLRRFVDLGGMLVFDDADGGTDRTFERDVRELLGRVLPGATVMPVSRDHVLYRSFYLVGTPVGRTQIHPNVLGVQEEGRLKVLVFRNDLGGALARGRDGHHLHPCVPGGAIQREWAIRFAVNILLYATCTDYKSDPAHVETLLREHGR